MEKRIDSNKVIDSKTYLVRSINPPLAGEYAYSVIPPFRVTSLLGGVIETPLKAFTASTIWRANEADRYKNEIFPDLLEEGKILKVGSINKNLKLELSAEGRKKLQELEIQYNL